ncbi:MAG: extracellular solute-binding protein, partial [Lentisphaerae bacterium]|nr:extracellular solute-binding protein [Lentisphaerota bacterium]
KKWIEVDHILPSAAEVASFSTDSGYGGAAFQLFYKGNFAMVSTGRFALVQFRQFGNLDLDAVEYPNGGYSNTIIATRGALVYKGGKHKDLSKYFLAYLASEDYNMNIVNDADALPPNPEFTKREEYLCPKDYPNEWKVHKKFAQDAVDISIILTKSPFVSNKRVYRYIEDYRQAVLSGKLTPEKAVKLCETRINEEIDRTILEKPKLRPEYDRQVELQKKIDEYRETGRKIPKEWISNPFHKKYYRDMGLLE